MRDRLMLLLADDFCLDRIFQPIGDWSHKRFGLHPQMIAEFFGLGAIFAQTAHQVLLRPLGLTPIGVFFSCIAIAMQIIWFMIIRRPMAHRSGRNPKRYIYFGLRFMYMLFTFIDLIQLPFGVMTGNTFVYVSDFTVSAFTWIALSFASLDEPPPREYRSLLYRWAT